MESEVNYFEGDVTHSEKADYTSRNKNGELVGPNGPESMDPT